MPRVEKSEITRFERDTGVNPGARGVDYGVEQVDTRAAAQGLSNLGRSLLANAEPILKERAIHRAEEDAGKQVPLARDINGHLTRPDPLPGGGTVYAEVFTKAVNVAYRQELDFQNQHDFDDIIKEHYNDPQTAWAALTAKSQAVLATVPNDLKIDVAGDMHREVTQRFNGLVNAKISRDRQLAEHELESGADKIWESWMIDGPDLVGKMDFPGLVARQEVAMQQIQENQEARIAMGILSLKGEADEDMLIASKMHSFDLEVTSGKGINGFITRSNEFAQDRQQLKLLQDWVQGDPSQGKGKFLGMTWSEYVAMVPTEKGRQYMANMANRMETDLNQWEADQLAAANAAKTSANEQRIRQAMAAGQDASAFKEMQNLIDSDEEEWIRQNGGNPTNAMLMRDPETGQSIGGQHLMDRIQQNGYLPLVWRAFLEHNVDGTNAEAVVGVLTEMANIKNNTGQLVGRRILRDQVSTSTKARADYYRMLMDQGMLKETRTAMMDQFVSGKKLTFNEIMSAFVDNNGKPSREAYMKVVSDEAFAITGDYYNDLPSRMRYEIDKTIQTYVSFFGTEHAKDAIQRAIEGVTTAFSKSIYGKDGWIPAELATLQMTSSEMDYAFGNYINGQGWKYGGGFSLTRGGIPRAVISLNEDSTIGAGLGEYTVTYFDDNGRLIPKNTRTININEGVQRVLRLRGSVQDEINRKRVIAAKKQREDTARRRKETPLLVPMPSGI